MSKTEQAPKSATETITLARPHVHRRHLHDKGDTLSVRPEQAKRLRERGVAT